MKPFAGNVNIAICQSIPFGPTHGVSSTCFEVVNLYKMGFRGKSIVPAHRIYGKSALDVDWLKQVQFHTFFDVSSNSPCRRCSRLQSTLGRFGPPAFDDAQSLSWKNRVMGAVFCLASTGSIEAI